MGEKERPVCRQAEKDDREVIKRYFRAKIRGVDSEKFTVDALVSDGSVDRHGTVIEPSAWKKDLKYYKDHPVLLSSHNHNNLRSQIGEAVSTRVTDEGLEAKFKYYVGEGNPEADWAFKLAEKGMAMFSVGFIDHEHEDVELKEGDDRTKKPWRRFKRVELVEISQVVVGSNRNALQRTADEAVTNFRTNTNPDPDLQALGNLAVEILEAFGKEIPDLDSRGGGDPDPSQDEEVVISDEVAERPYPNEHACRLRPPEDFQKGSFRRVKRKHNGKEYSIIMGKLKGKDTMTEQAYRYPKDVWSEEEARKHCEDHKGNLFEPAQKEEKKEKYVCECIECGHTLETSEHCARLKCPKCGGQMRRKERPGPGQKAIELDLLTVKERGGVVPFRPEGKAPEDRPWDAAAARRRVAIWAGGPDKDKINWDKFKRAFAFVRGDGENFGDYLFPHHDVIDGALVTVWRGCVAALVRLFGTAKDLSEVDRKGIYNHIKKHYAQFDKEPPEFKDFSSEELAEIFGGEDDEDGSGQARPEPGSKGVYSAILKDDSAEGNEPPSRLASLIAEAEKVRRALKEGK